MKKFEIFVGGIVFFAYLTLPCSSQIIYSYATQLCNTDTCNAIAARLTARLNLSVNPCENFYEFACGRFISGRRRIDDMYDGIRKNMTTFINNILDTTVTNNSSRITSFLKEVKGWCMRPASTNVNTSIRFLNQFGRWPILFDSYIQGPNETFSYIDFVNRSRLAGYVANELYSVYVQNDEVDPMSRVIFVDLPKSQPNYLPYPYSVASFSLYTDYQSINAEFLEEILRTIGAQNSNGSLAERIDFQIRIAAALRTIYASYNPSNRYQRIQVGQIGRVEDNNTLFNLEFRNYDFRRLFEAHLGVPVGVFDTVVFRCKTCFENAFNSQLLYPAEYKSYYLLGYVLDSLFALDKNLRGRFVRHEDYCNTEIRKWFYPFIDQEYLSSVNYGNSSRYQITAIYENLRSVLRRNIASTRAFATLHKQSLLQKIDRMNVKIMYDEMLDEGGKYSRRNLTRMITDANNYVNFYSILKFAMRTIISDNANLYLNNDYQPLPEYMAAVSTDIRYGYAENTIYIPAGIALSGVTSPDRLLFIDYALLGFFIGRELMHAVDSVGRLQDSFGGILCYDTNITRRYVDNCLIDYYNQQRDPELMEPASIINGFTTMDENFADVEGARLAHISSVIRTEHLAYTLWRYQQFNERQLFWINFASIFCGRLSPEEEAAYIAIGTHSPNSIRVNGVVSLSPEFAQDFNCQCGPMNRIRKCNFMRSTNDGPHDVIEPPYEWVFNNVE